MAASGAGGERRPRPGPAPIASFDHDASDESSPETKQTFRLPEIREDGAAAAGGEGLAPPEQRARSHSSPAVAAAAPGALHAAAPRIDISRASSSSHHDSRDSSPELALFAGGGSGADTRAKLELGFREDGALDLRSSTEELAFLENVPGNAESRGPPTAPPSRRHSRKDSQGSETALLAVSGRTSRISSVGSQCSAQSALSGFSHASRVSRLSVVSGMSRSPSPHKMLLETSFCGPKPIETDPEICAAEVEERLLEIAKISTEEVVPDTLVDARDRREVRTEVTVESSSVRHAAAHVVSPVSKVQASAQNTTTISTTIALTSTTTETVSASKPKLLPADEEKRLKETRNRARVEERKARSRERRDHSEPEVYKTSNRSKDIIRIKLKPDEEYDDDDDESDRTLISGEPARKPITLELSDNCIQTLRPHDAISTSPHMTRRPRDSRTPSPSGVPVSRKSSFCSLFKSRDTITSPDSPSDVLKRKKSLNEGRSRSKSRDRTATPTSAGKIKGSVLSLFKTPRKSVTSTSPNSRDGSPVVQAQRQFPQTPVDRTKAEKLKYYEDAKEGIIHIPLHTPPDELESKSDKIEVLSSEVPRPSSAPQVRSMPDKAISPMSAPTSKPTQRTVLPDGSIIIPLHSPTEKSTSTSVLESEEKSIEPKPVPNNKQLLRETKITTDDVKTTETFSRTSQEAAQEVVSGQTEAVKEKRKERFVFTTHVGSREQVFSTQFSITKTPSVTSESIPSFPENDDIKMLPDTEIIISIPETSVNQDTDINDTAKEDKIECIESANVSAERSGAGTPQDAGRESSESEGGSETVARGGSDVERRGLVVQESFEELPYVPTTLPQERSVAVPIVPVRERGGVRVASLQRPRGRPAAPGPPGPPDPAAVPAVPPRAPRDADRLRISLPRRPRAASASAAPPKPERPRTRSGSEVGSSRKAEWIDFSEVPERRKLPKRIETVPAERGGGGVVSEAEAEAVSYVPAEQCRCECHAARLSPSEDEVPLLHDHAQHLTVSSSSAEGGADDADDALFAADLQTLKRAH